MSTVRYRNLNGLCRIWKDEKLQAMFWMLQMDVTHSRTPLIEDMEQDPWFYQYRNETAECTLQLKTLECLYTLTPSVKYHRVYCAFSNGDEYRFNRGLLTEVSWDHAGYEKSITSLRYIFSKRMECYTQDEGNVHSFPHLPDIPLFPFYRSILIPFGSDFSILKKFEKDLLFGKQNEEEKETIRGIYVDWLGDNGDHEYAELVRNHGLSFEKLVQLSKEQESNVVRS